MTDTIECYIVDAFTDEPFKGNPAGVCLLSKDIDDLRMLAIAKELGLSETAFISSTIESQKFVIRYFSPKMEIPLCGHATLASSKVLFEKMPTLTRIHFQTIEGIDLLIARDGESIVMEFPIYETIAQDAPDELLSALGIKKMNNSVFNKETNILLIEIESSQVLSSLRPNFEQLLRAHNSINGVLVTAKSNRDNYDFESRYFWPWSGTNEDPVTGATHTFLTKYWSERLNKKRMNAFQCSERTGFMQVELLDANRMTIKAPAQIILRGELLV